MHLPAILDRALALYADQPAVSCGGEWLSYREIGDRVARLAGALAVLGVEPGDRVAAWLPNRREYLETYFAVARTGAVLVPVNHRLAVPEILGVLEHSGACCLVVDPTWSRAVAQVLVAAPGLAVLGVGDDYERALNAAEPLRPVAPLASGDDPAQLYYTSGTTGDPKGVVLTHTNVAHHALMAVAELGLSDRDTWLHAAPMFHLADAWATFAVTWVGGRHVMLPRFEPAAALEVLADGGVTLTNLVPTMLGALVREPGAATRDYPTLRVLLSGGAPIAPELVERIRSTFGCEYLQTYGLTETSPYLTFSTPSAHLDALPEAERAWYRACTGRPLAGVEVRVVDGDGRDVPRDRRTVGEIIARGPSVTPGYWRNPQATAAAIRHGWLHTGDLAVMDAHGYVDIVDRAKDVIVTGGEQVFSVEVESALMAHPDVVEVAVVASPDERWGEAVTAVVVRRAGSEVGADELVDHCHSRLARYKAPRRIDFVEALPRTGSQKIDKRAVRERYWSGQDRRVH